MGNPAKNTICLWYDDDAEDAARFYAKTFPDSSVGAVLRAPGDFPSGKKGDVLTVEFTVLGIPCLGLNGGPAFQHNEAFSFQIATADQAETDRYWNAIVGNGGRGERVRLVQGQMGLVLADHADRPDERDRRSRSRRRQASVRGNDGDGKDRHRRHRGGAPRQARVAAREFFDAESSAQVPALAESRESLRYPEPRAEAGLEADAVPATTA